MNRPQSPIPRYMLWDSHLGHQARTKDQGREIDAEDRAAAEAIVRIAEENGLHVEIGRFSHDGPPFFAAAMPMAVKERLMAAQNGPDGPTEGSPRQIKLGNLLGLPGYTDGQLSRADSAA
jgi:hypothetical protein